MQIVDVADKERFEARTDEGTLAGVVTYQLTGPIVVYTHTEVYPEFEGRGIGTELAQAVMDDARTRGRTVVPMCPFLADWLDKHPDYEDVVARDTRKLK
jgi:predicted GNAT family acetyltransferase